MSKGKPIRVYDYVNKPYKDVREQLIWIGLEVFYKATKSAASQSETVKPELHVNFGEFRLAAEISIKINEIRESETAIGRGRVTTLDLEWEAAKMPALFPLMRAELLVYPLTATETQLQLEGYYEPPFGVIGSAMDDIAGHRIAEESVQHFISDVAGYLRGLSVYHADGPETVIANVGNEPVHCVG